MPWEATDPMQERVQFMAASFSEVYPMTEWCERFGLRRNPGSKWVRRSTERGVVGLQEKGRAPHRRPQRISAEAEAALLEAKRAHPNRGPRKLLPYLARHRPDRTFPAASTAGALFRRAGLRRQRIAPGRPEQHGAHERMHRPLKAGATRPPEPHQQAPQGRFDRCCREYNQERPHEALDDRTPASVYRPPTRPMPTTLPPPAYPGHSLVRRVRNAGTFRCQARQRFISATLLPEEIALEETGDGIRSLSFDAVLLARLDERDFRLDA
jgi:hypothetical protein